MRLRELDFPIAVLKPSILMGGFGAGLDNKKRFDWNLADFYLRGGYDHAVIYDSSGRKLNVELIELRQPAWWRFALDRLGHFLIFRNPSLEQMVDVDMQLSLDETLSFEAFCREMLGVLLKNPDWWRDTYSESQVLNLFDGDTTISEAIDHIGILEGSRAERLAGTSRKIRDFRNN